MDAGTSLGRGTVARIGPRLLNREDNTALGAGDGGRIDTVPLIDAARAIDFPLSVDDDNEELSLFFKLVPRGPLRELRREEDTPTNPDEREVADMIGCCCCCCCC